MDDKKLFSQHYSTDTSKYEDKEKFRLRLLKYLEDFTNHHFPQNIYLKCRSQMGVDIERIPMPNLRRPDQERYAVEGVFAKKSIHDILDFVGVCYYALSPCQNDNPHLVDSLKRYLEEVNTIFREESMCYEIHDDGRVRYYPDAEFQAAVKSTLTVLHKPKYRSYLASFNDALDDMYKNPNTESPLNRLFKLVETFALSTLNNDKHNRLNYLSAKDLIDLLKEKSKLDHTVTETDRDALAAFYDALNGWVKMNHKYRHGKPEQQSIALPAPIFNMIFSTGISTLRFLLELDDKYQLISTEGGKE